MGTGLGNGKRPSQEEDTQSAGPKVQRQSSHWCGKYLGDRSALWDVCAAVIAQSVAEQEAARRSESRSLYPLCLNLKSVGFNKDKVFLRYDCEPKTQKPTHFSNFNLLSLKPSPQTFTLKIDH